jgi:hypothetical protein
MAVAEHSATVSLIDGAWSALIGIHLRFAICVPKSVAPVGYHPAARVAEPDAVPTLA